MRVSLLITALFVVLSHPDLADACSCFPPEDHGFLIEESKELPSNAKGLVWIGLTSPETEHFEVVQVVNGEEKGTVAFYFQRAKAMAVG